jgi:transposase
VPIGDGKGIEIIDLPGTFPLVLPICRVIRLMQIVDEVCPMKDGDHLTHGQVCEFVLLLLLHADKRSPLYKMDEWAAQHNVHEIYGFEPEAFNDDRIGRTLDALSEHVMEIQTAVVTQALAAYDIDPRIVHWDLMSVVCADGRQRSELVQSGYGGGLIHERQVQLSLQVTSQAALPILHHALAGNVAQPPLAPEMLAAVQAVAGRSDVIIVSDRKGISYDSIQTYRRAGAHFLGPLTYRGDTPLARRLAAVPPEAFAPLSYRSLNAPERCDGYHATTIAVQPLAKREPIEVQALFIDSPHLRQDAQRTRRKQVERALQQLHKICGYLNQRRYAKAAYATERLHKAVPPALEGLLRYELSGEDGALSLTYELDEAALAAASVSAGDGRYVLVYDLPEEPSPDEIFALYRRQGVIEQRFRTLNTDLDIHPLWLQKENRIAALILLFVLSLLVYGLLEHLSVRAGLSSRWYHKLTARELIQRFRGVRLIRIHARGQPPRHQLVIPEEQQDILDQLQMPDAKRYLH